MKTKIIYISGNEIFDVADIHIAFEEVRNALNLDKETVLFGVPVDADDAGLMSQEAADANKTKGSVKDMEEVNVVENMEYEPVGQEIKEPVAEVVDEIVTETVITEKPKKRGRRTKELVAEENVEETIVATTESEEKIVPILSVLATKEEITEPEIEERISETTKEETVTEEIPDETIEDIDEQEIADENVEDTEEADLEKLLSAMTPLQEDVVDDKKVKEVPDESGYNDDLSVDATLEQLATEFAETQDKIATGNKSSSRSKIGKLRNILPFKQSKHKDQGLGDLFGWAGVAANDEDFSVPGFFTNATSKK